MVMRKPRGAISLIAMQVMIGFYTAQAFENPEDKAKRTKGRPAVSCEKKAASHGPVGAFPIFPTKPSPHPEGSTQRNKNIFSPRKALENFHKMFSLLSSPRRTSIASLEKEYPGEKISVGLFHAHIMLENNRKALKKFKKKISKEDLELAAFFRIINGRAPASQEDLDSMERPLENYMALKKFKKKISKEDLELAAFFRIINGRAPASQEDLDKMRGLLELKRRGGKNPSPTHLKYIAFQGGHVLTDCEYIASPEDSKMRGPLKRKYQKPGRRPPLQHGESPYRRR